MSARFIVSNEIDVTIYDDLAQQRIWVEVDVKAPGADPKKHTFEADISRGAVKVKDKNGYVRLAHHVPVALIREYETLL